MNDAKGKYPPLIKSTEIETGLSRPLKGMFTVASQMRTYTSIYKYNMLKKGIWEKNIPHPRPPYMVKYDIIYVIISLSGVPRLRFWP